VEYTSNVYKNDLEEDRSYLRDVNMFINLLSLYTHFPILNIMYRNTRVRDVLSVLSRIKV
jgi:hypothetical protein